MITRILIHRIAHIGLAATLMLNAGSALASNGQYCGKLDVAYVFHPAGVAPLANFAVLAKALGLFATGSDEALMRAAMFAKAPVCVGYEIVPCLPGVSGACGNVNFLSVVAPL